MRLRLAFAALAAAAVPVLVAPAHPAEAQAQRDWSRTVALTPEGGVRMGNPEAGLKLVEYGSITCPHCAQFSADSAAALRSRYVRSGRVSFEYRPYLIFPTDPGAFLLLGCLGPAGFFPAAEQLYAEQVAWSGRFSSLPRAERERIRALPPLEQTAAIVRAAGIDRYFLSRGMSQARIDACLADELALDRLADITERAGAIGVQGTPTFLLNGRLIGGQEWSTLEPMLGGG